MLVLLLLASFPHVQFEVFFFLGLRLLSRFVKLFNKRFNLGKGFFEPDNVLFLNLFINRSDFAVLNPLAAFVEPTYS